MNTIGRTVVSFSVVLFFGCAAGARYSPKDKEGYACQNSCRLNYNTCMATAKERTTWLFNAAVACSVEEKDCVVGCWHFHGGEYTPEGKTFGPPPVTQKK